MVEVRPRSQQQQRSENPQRDAALIAAIAALLVIGAPPRPTATKIAALIGISVAAVMPVVALAMGRPFAANVTSISSKSPTATGESAEAEPLYRAAYILAASRRVQDASAQGRSRDQALVDEQRWFNLHMEAQAKRRKAAAAVDRAARRHGAILGWYAVLDNRTSPECREANGKNFNVAVRPAIGYPGSVHPHCRCKAGKQHATSATVYSVKPERKAS